LGSEFTTKDAALQGGFSGNRSYAERKIVGFGDCVVVVVVVVVVVRGAIPGF
jgi:t-SNARE complex subunit (syntaxin)